MDLSHADVGVCRRLWNGERYLLRNGDLLFHISRPPQNSMSSSSESSELSPLSPFPVGFMGILGGGIIAGAGGIIMLKPHYLGGIHMQ